MALSVSRTKGWQDVEIVAGSSRPPPRVGATLTCIEVPLHAKGLTKEEVEMATVASEAQQYGLFLFGGDDKDDRQTDWLHVYYLQDRKWVKPTTTGRNPTKRSRHTANTFADPKTGTPRLLLFGGVNASNALSVLDPWEFNWTHPSAKAAQVGIFGRRGRRQSNNSRDQEEEIPTLPCARFGHTTLYYEQKLYVFGGRDHQGVLKDVFELQLAKEPFEWHRPEPACAARHSHPCVTIHAGILTRPSTTAGSGHPPPPSAKHTAALARDHMLIISGETSWAGHLWALKLTPPLTWFRSAVGDFPLIGLSRHR